MVKVAVVCKKVQVNWFCNDYKISSPKLSYKNERFCSISKSQSMGCGPSTLIGYNVFISK